MKTNPLRLGEILEQRGRLAREQTLRALRNQKVLGGRLGTCLLEIDAIAEEDLLRSLAEIHNVPAASADDLRNIPAEVIALVPAKVAQRCQAIPFHVSSTAVKVAVANARDLGVQDEISFVVGKRIRWHVAAELRIHEALERFYGVECPTRFAKLLDRLNRSRFLWSRDAATSTAASETISLPAWELPPLIPTAVPSVDGAASDPKVEGPPAPVADSSASAEVLVVGTVAESPGAPPAAAPDVETKVEPPSAPERQPLPTPAPAPAAGREPAAVPAPPPAPDDDTQDLAARLGTVTPLTLAEAEQRLLDPSDRDGVARTVIEFAGSRCRRAVLLVVRRSEIAAWLWSGEGLDAPALAAYRVQLDETSIFQGMFGSASEMFRGQLPPVPAHQALLAAFRPPPIGSEVVALPIRVRSRLVAVLVAEPLPGSSPGELAAELQRVSAKAAIAFELCIMRAKLRRA